LLSVSLLTRYSYSWSAAIHQGSPQAYRQGSVFKSDDHVRRSDWAVRPIALTSREGRPILILEDPGGEPLSRFLGEPMELSRFLRFATNLASALGKLHQRGLIHKDIKPANILVDVEANKVWLTGFGIASRLPRERQSPEPPEVIAGTRLHGAGTSGPHEPVD
jgi:serine/threonine protein kinase